MSKDQGMSHDHDHDAQKLRGETVASSNVSDPQSLHRAEQLQGATIELRHHQLQLDPDGAMVGVSREALEIVLAAAEARHVRVDLTMDASEARAAIGEVGDLLNNVTRFLTHPDCRVMFADSEARWRVGAVRVDAGVVTCDLQNLADDSDMTTRPLSDLWPDGPASDFMRQVVKRLAVSFVEDAVAQLIDLGALRKPDPADLPAQRTGKEPHPDWHSGGPTEHGEGGGHQPMLRDEAAVRTPQFPDMEQIVAGPDSETVHHLGCHPEYIMDPKGTGTTPADKIDDA